MILSNIAVVVDRRLDGETQLQEGRAEADDTGGCGVDHDAVTHLMPEYNAVFPGIMKKDSMARQPVGRRIDAERKVGRDVGVDRIALSEDQVVPGLTGFREIERGPIGKDALPLG